jgi:hypothetical protein
VSEKKLSQKERVFRAIVQLLGEKYDPAKNMAVYFYPINPYKGNVPAPPPGFDEFEKMERETKEHSYETTKTIDCPIRGKVEEQVNIRRLLPTLTAEQEKMRALANAYKKILDLSKIEIIGFDKYGHFPFPENPLFVKLIELADVPRIAVFDALRRDPRLNGGSKRKWKTKKQRLYAQLVRDDYLASWNGAWTQSYQSSSVSEAEKELLKLKINLRRTHMFLAATGLLEALPEEIANDIGLDTEEIIWLKSKTAS